MAGRGGAGPEGGAMAAAERLRGGEEGGIDGGAGGQTAGSPRAAGDIAAGRGKGLACGERTRG